MHFKKRLLILCCAVILMLPYFCVQNDNPTTVLPSCVDGWNQNTSKNASSYVNENLKSILAPTEICGQKKLLVVFVNIRPDNFEGRRAIRDTWASQNKSATFYFLMGQDKNHNFEVQLKIREESQTYNDIFQENFIDSYNNLTLKSIHMLKLFHLHCSKKFKYLMKIDDDVFLNVPKVIQMLERRNKETDLLVGKIIKDTKPFRDPQNKWYIPYELYPDEKYPPYLCGPTYLMSADIAEKLYNCSFSTPIFHIEDVYITGICALKVNATPQHHPSFTCNEMNKYICIQKDIFTLHFYTNAEMRKSYQLLTENSCPPNGSLLEWIHTHII